MVSVFDIPRHERTEETRRALASDSVSTRDKLRCRLLSARHCLAAYYRQHFRAFRVDFENRRLIGQNGYYLQWTNESTTVGVVTLERDE